MTRDTAIQERDERKCRTYMDLSTTLAQTSSSAAKLLEPTLASLTESSTSAKDRVDRETKALGYLWEDIMDLFTTGISKTVSRQLEEALETLDAAALRSSETTLSSSALKRKASDHARLPPYHKESREESPARESHYLGTMHSGDKRRRLTDVPSPLTIPAGSPSPRAGELEVEAFLRGLKDKVETQARTLELLARENTQVRSSICCSSR